MSMSKVYLLVVGKCRWKNQEVGKFDFGKFEVGKKNNTRIFNDNNFSNFNGIFPPSYRLFQHKTVQILQFSNYEVLIQKLLFLPIFHAKDHNCRQNSLSPG